MTPSYSIPVQQAVIAALKADAGVAALVGARVYDEVVALPTWPFIRYGFPGVTPFRADGWYGEVFAITVHCFAKGPGQESVLAVAAAVKAALDDNDLAINSGGGVMLLQFDAQQVIRDTDEASAYHAIVQLSAAVAEIAA